jgi:hypothetical protein
MNRMLRWAQWAVIGTAVLMLFWVAATVGGWSPDLRLLTTGVHGPLVADYRADSIQALAPLSPDITQDASGDQSAPQPSQPTPSPSPSGVGPSPTPSGSVILSPTPSLPVPTLPIPSLPTTLPSPSLPTTLASPSLPTGLPLPTPSLQTPPPLP